MTKNPIKNKSKMTVAEAGAKGGAISARNIEAMNAARAKARAVFARRFNNDEEKSAYYRKIGEKGKAAQAAKKAKKVTHI